MREGKRWDENGSIEKKQDCREGKRDREGNCERRK